MYILKGFIAYPTLTDNTVGETAPIGEISKDSLTYRKETGLYKSGDYPNVILHSFSSNYEDELEPITVPVEYQKLALKVGRFILDQSLSGELTDDQEKLLHDLNAEFEEEATDFEIHGMVYDGERWAPELLVLRGDDIRGGEENRIQLWFSDEAFGYQYDEYEYEFIAPVENLDDFFGNREQVKASIQQKGFDAMISRAEKLRGHYPYTVMKNRVFNWIDTDADEYWEMETNWLVLVYGVSGNDPERIREELADWILVNSDHPREDWVEIFPDIFSPREFIITPMWSQYAIPNKTIQAGVYSPLIGLSHAIELARQTCNGHGYSNQEVLDNTMATSLPYKSLGLLITGNGENRDGLTLIYEHFPDYISVTSQSHDFARMDPNTQEWVWFINELVYHAEITEEYGFSPAGFSRIERDGVYYIAKDFGGIHFLVVLRETMSRLVEPNAPYWSEFPDDWKEEHPDFPDHPEYEEE